MLMKPLLQFDEYYLYAKNLKQEKYQKLIREMRKVSNDVGYEILNVSNDKIISVSEMDYEDNQTLVIFDDYICEKKQTVNWLFYSGKAQKLFSYSNLSQSKFLLSTKRNLIKLLTLLCLWISLFKRAKYDIGGNLVWVRKK